jgi:phosphatidylserine/phosphatidylglycerophosphate/cardiolipin synthase-like enzyme
MSKEIIGYLVTEADAVGSRKRLEGYRVSVRLPGSLFDYNGSELASAVSEGAGRFQLSARGSPSLSVRHLDIVAYDNAGRELPFAPSTADFPGYVVTDGGRARIEDRADEPQQNYGEFTIREADATGLQVTLGTGEVRRFTDGNRVTTLMDRDAFTYAAAMIRHARQEVLMSQLFFAIPTVFSANPTHETPSLIFDFGPPGSVIDLNQPRAVRADDRRPERLIIDTAQRSVDIRILLHAFKVPLFIKIVAGILLFPFVGTEGISLVQELFGSDLTDTDEAKRYFGDAGATNVKVQAFEQPVLSAGVMHAKLMMMDRSRMLSIGSPFGQSYVDRQDHPIDAWIRGGATGYPKHDAGFTMTGPAWADFFDTMRLLWNDASPGDPLAVEMKDPHFPPMVPPPPGPSVLDQPEDGVCSIQIVRTLSCDQFDSHPKGEKGILEAYLRGFAKAREFIYLETQYFTNDAIGDGLVDAMLSSPHLKVIVLLNIEPDVPTYPFKQRRLITRIRRAIGQKATGPQRFGVFTRWTHETSGPRPRILPVYIHAKVGIIDNTWATVGSANLDGLSLDSSLPSDILHGLFNRDEQRAIEVNAVMFDQQQPPANVVDILRRKLWAEHLGYLDPATGTPNIAAPALQDANKPPEGWLKFWSDHAAATLDHVTKTPAVPSTGKARVLPWPTDNSTHKTPRDHLTALGVLSYKVAPLKSTRAFDFKTGNWKPGSTPKMDFD